MEEAMYKNVSLRLRTIDGIPTWRLLGPDGQPIAAFEAFAHSLRKEPKNTRDSYCRHLAEFFDYLIEVSALLANDRQLTKLELSQAIDAYWDYLRMGADASSQTAREVAAQRPPGANAAASLAPKKSAVRRFLRLSEEVRKELAEVARLRGDSPPKVDNVPLLPELGKRRELQPYEVRAMQANLVTLFYDHRSGEAADYIAVIRSPEGEVDIGLYHCKGAGGAPSGGRVGDVYEVAGQLVKSVYYCDVATLLDHMEDRMHARHASPSRFISGNLVELRQLLQATLATKLTFTVVGVQPGISRRRVDAHLADLMLFGVDYAKRGGAARAYWLTSE